MSRPHMSTHPLGRTSCASRRARSERNNFARLFQAFRDARRPLSFVRRSHAPEYSTEASLGDRWRATVIDSHLGRKTRQGNDPTNQLANEKESPSSCADLL